MKRISFITAIVIALSACNDSDHKDASTTGDSSHINHKLNRAGENPDTSQFAGKPMMTMMESMMESMKKIPSTGSPDNDFAALMKAHHLGAVQMAEMEVANGKDNQIIQMAQKMMEDQQKEVAELNTFLSGHSAHGGGDTFHKEAMEIMNSMKMNMDHSGTIDKQFVQLMIPHHQSAIDMAKAYIKSGGHEEKLKTMATNIISSQAKEITQLQDWLTKH